MKSRELRLPVEHRGAFETEDAISSGVLIGIIVAKFYGSSHSPSKWVFEQLLVPEARPESDQFPLDAIDPKKPLGWIASRWDRSQRPLGQ
jgi:hypothetical protein